MRTFVISPHPDDEVLGCGGTLLKRKAEGADLAWLIVTGISEKEGWSSEQVELRDQEIEKIAEEIGFSEVFNLRLPTAQLDRLPMGDLIGHFSNAFNLFQPNEVFLPHFSDVHTDHGIVFNAAAACSKWFRYPSVQRVLAYETISETDFGLRPDELFRPTVFVDIAEYIDSKIELMKVYQSEMGEFPFPRSEKAIRAQALLRGAAAGYEAAEAFQLLKERS